MEVAWLFFCRAEDTLGVCVCVSIEHFQVRWMKNGATVHGGLCEGYSVPHQQQMACGMIEDCGEGMPGAHSLPPSPGGVILQVSNSHSLNR